MTNLSQCQLAIQRNLLYSEPYKTRNGTALAAAPARVVFLSSGLQEAAWY